MAQRARRARVSVPAPHPSPVTAAYAILLAREPDEAETREAAKDLAGGTPLRQVGERLISSPEFRLLHASYAEGGTGHRGVAAVEGLLRSLGSDRAFLARCYDLVFDRPADAEGLAYFVRRLGEGADRFHVLRDLIASDEFDTRYRALCPEAGVLPRDVQLCELANPAKWDNPDWVAVLRSLGEPPERLSMHRKAYESTQMLWGLARLGRITPDARVLSVGAGHEKPLYWLANRVRLVVGTDLYAGEWQSSWAREGDTDVLRRPAEYAPFPYPPERLVLLKMDGRALGFAEATFDAAYSLSSIEHFGGLDGARRAIDEMVRVLRPGGVLALATEYCLTPARHHEAFQPHEVRALIDHPSLRLVQPIDERVYERYEAQPVDLRRNRFQTPHMVVRDGEAVFTSVMAFLVRN
jgi:SAM-dependent methyltransferase